MLDDQRDRQGISHFGKYSQANALAVLSRQGGGADGDAGSAFGAAFEQLLDGMGPKDARARRRRHPRILNEQAYDAAALLCDAVIIVLVSLCTGTVYHLAAFGGRGETSVYFGGGILVSLLFCGISRLKALRLPFGTSSAYERARAALSSWIAAFAMFLFVAFTMKIVSELSRGAILSFFVVGAAAAIASRIKTPLVLARVLRRNTLDGQDIIVIGPQSDPQLFRLIADLRRTVRQEPCMVMFDGTCSDEAWSSEIKRTLEHTYRFAHGSGPGEILVVGASLPPDRLSVLLEGLAEIPRSICVVPDGFTASCLRQKKTAIGKSIAVEIQKAPLGFAQRAVKRAVDVSLSAGALMFLAPLLATIAIAIKCDSPGPVLFRQTRTGYRGRTFRIFKFRTMTVLEDGPSLAQAQKNDRRVTRLGSFLRRSSLDELPQLLNVLSGDMSLVGPRPHALAHDKLYEQQIQNYTLRQHLRPGITGWAQVNGLRGETSTMDAMSKRVEHDVWYVRHCSPFLDIQIMARTVFEVLRGRNAY